MSEDEHGLPLAEWEQQHESERQAWAEHKMAHEDLQSMREEIENGA